MSYGCYTQLCLSFILKRPDFHVLADFFQNFWRIFCIDPILTINLLIYLIFKTVLIEKRCSAWHKNTNILLFFLKIVILGFYAGKSHNLIGLRIFHGDLDFFDL